MSLSANFPTSKPTLNLDFANVGALDPRITFSRTSSATYTNSLGLIATAAAGVARFDYDPSTLAARGLLVEEQRTNLLTYSEQFDNAAWAKGTFGATQTVTANAGAAPDGTVTAEQVTLSRSNASTDYTYLVQPVTLASTAIHAGSVYMKAATSGDVGKQVALWQFDGTVKNVVLVTLTANWQRYSPLTTSTLTSGGSREPLCIGYRTTSEGGGTQTGSVSFFVWGAQAELGSFSTSYIPTVASTVTRNADVATVSTLTPWWNGTEGTFLFDFNQVGTSAIGIIGDDTFNNSLRFNIAQMARGVGAGFANAVLLGTSQNGSRKLAVAMKVNDYAGSFDGGAVSTQTTASMVPSTTVLGVGRDYGTNGYMNGWMRRLSYYPARLTNAQLQALTS